MNSTKGMQKTCAALGVAVLLLGSWILGASVRAAEAPAQASATVNTNSAASLPSLDNLKNLSVQQKGEARTALERAAQAGNADAMIRLAHLLWSPLEGGYDEGAKAVYWFERAYVSGRKDVCSNLGRAYVDGAIEHRVDYVRAVDWFSKGVESDDAASELSLGWMHLEGHGVKADFDAGFKLIQRSADKGYPQALRNLGRLFAYDGVPMLPPWKPDYAKAAALYQEAINKGDKDAVTRLARLRVEHRITTSDADEEASVRQAMATTGRMEPILWLAHLIESGKAKARSDEEAPLQLYYRAAAGGNDEALRTLGAAYRTGKGVPKDLLVTAHYVAMIYLINMEEFAPEDDKELAPYMVRYLNAAWAKNDRPAMNMGKSYLEGRDLYQSDFEAYVWFAHAARLGDAAAVAARDKAKAKLSELELGRAGERIHHLKEQADDPWNMRGGK